jgi:hypothetical protein
MYSHQNFSNPFPLVFFGHSFPTLAEEIKLTSVKMLE